MIGSFVALVDSGTPASRLLLCGLAMKLATVGMEIATERSNLIILLDKGSAHCALPDRAGAVIGHLFDGDNAVEALPDLAAKQIRETQGDYLIKNYWGGYVAILAEDDGQSIHIVRDPSGAKPCYYLEKYGVTIITSNLERLLAAKMIDVEIDWGYLTRHLLAEQLRPARTGLIGVTELLNGYRLSLNQGQHTLSERWSPWSFAAPQNQIRDFREASTLLRDVTQRCIGAWAGRFDHVLLGVSGGLDSSIVGACVHRAGRELSLFTLVTKPGSVGDERGYARLLAEHLGLSLFECHESVERIYIDRSDALHVPRPVARSFAQSGDRHSLDIAAKVGADVFFSGGGGDNVFCLLQSVAPLADRLRLSGIGKGSWQTALNIADMTETPVMTIMRKAVHRAWFRESRYRWSLDSSMLTTAAIQAAGNVLDHPLLDTPPGGLPGTAAHIAMLLAIQNYLDGLNRERILPIISPLLSQPIIETVMRIASWLWVDGAEDRAVARHAFSDMLPLDILQRKVKGSPDPFVAEIYQHHRKELATLLLDGLLVQHGIVSRAAVEAYLVSNRIVQDQGFWRIMILADVESWARGWQSRASTVN